jgi:hypothetical protein
VPDAGQRRINRADREGKSLPFQREHFRVAESLREHRVPRIKVGKSHVLEFRIPTTHRGGKAKQRIFPFDYHHGNLSEIRSPPSEIRRTERLFQGPSQNRVRGTQPYWA